MALTLPLARVLTRLLTQSRRSPSSPPLRPIRCPRLTVGLTKASALLTNRHLCPVDLNAVIAGGVVSVSLLLLLATVAGILGWWCRKGKRFPGDRGAEIVKVCIHQVKDVSTLTAIQYTHTHLAVTRACRDHHHVYHQHICTYTHASCASTVTV